MDRYPIRVTLLANAGVLIRYRDTALLLDGLFGRKDNPFSLLPPGCREAMLRAEPPFERLDYLLFTRHTDRAGHFGAGVYGAPPGRGVPGRPPCVLSADL